MRISRHAIPYAWACAAGWLACYFPIWFFNLRLAIRSRDNLLPSLPAARAIQQCTSWRTDYYGHSVAIGLAPLRRSHVRQRCTCQRDLGVPFVSFNALTGHRSSAPGGLQQVCSDPAAGAGTGFRRLSGRWAVCTFWRLGLRQSSFRHITRIPRRAAPYAWTRPPVSWHAIFPFSPFGSWVSHQIQRHLLSSLPAARAIQRCASWRSYNTARPHRALSQSAPAQAATRPPQINLAQHRLRRKQVLSGLIYEYLIAA